MEKVENDLQLVMDSAYGLWRDNEQWSYEDFMFNIPALERRAVALGNLNYQVNNGGFMQWIDNGYAKDTQHVLRVIAREIEDEAGYDQLKKALEMALAAPTTITDYYDDKVPTDAFYALDSLVDEMNHFIGSFRV
jgi:hypothetical protein